jgi:hypothetical protein
MRPEHREREAVLSPLDVGDGMGHAAAPEVGAVDPAPATGVVKLSPSTLTQQQLLETLQRVNVGMIGTPAYSSLPIMTEISTAAGAFASFLGNLAVDEQKLKQKRLEAVQWAKSYGGLLIQAALACELADSTPATLVSGGWELRSHRSAPQVPTPPENLRLMQTQFPGKGVAKWKLERNVRYYEVRVDPVPSSATTITESALLTTTQARCDLPPVTPGSLVQICVRAIGVKGASPFCNPLTVRVN